MSGPVSTRKRNNENEPVPVKDSGSFRVPGSPDTKLRIAAAAVGLMILLAGIV